MNPFASDQVSQFLISNPEMAIVPSTTKGIVIEGSFAFTATADNFPVISDSYRLRVIVSSKYPTILPDIEEIGGRIPRTQSWHVFSTNGLLCLGSPIRLKMLLVSDPSLTGFFTNCVIPYLYAVSLKNGGISSCGF